MDLSVAREDLRHDNLAGDTAQSEYFFAAERCLRAFLGALKRLPPQLLIRSHRADAMEDAFIGGGASAVKTVRWRGTPIMEYAAGFRSPTAD